MKPIRIRYDADANAAYLRLSEERIMDSAEVSPNLALDYDSKGHIVGIELLDARSRLSADLLSEVA